MWLTLPVSSGGLLPDALGVVADTLRAGVDLAGVNVMAMDFGEPDIDMFTAVEAALTATQAQVLRTYRDQGRPLTSTEAWNKVGGTVMIGQNDIEGEVFTVVDAQALMAFAATVPLGRLSMWSLNRDSQCGGAAFADVAVLSNTCSGTTQTELEFSRTMSALEGDVPTRTARTLKSPTTTVPASPSNDPYPAWQPAATYVEGTRVVRNGFVYQAKWYNQNTDPAAVLAAAHLGPWQLIGPVLPTDRAPTTTTLPVGTYPEWSPATPYPAGTRVLLDGRPFEAKWYNQGASPDAAMLDASVSPWRRLFTVPGEPPHQPVPAGPGVTSSSTAAG